MYFPEESFFFEFEVMVTPRQFLAGGEKREKTDEDSDPAAPAAGLAPDPSTQLIKKELCCRGGTHTTSLTNILSTY